MLGKYFVINKSSAITEMSAQRRTTRISGSWLILGEKIKSWKRAFAKNQSYDKNDGHFADESHLRTPLWIPIESPMRLHISE